MNIKHLADQNYFRFYKLEGSEYIATGFALYQINKIIKIFNVKSILELGLGIGSISDTVLKMAKFSKRNLRYVGTESNEFCKHALLQNVEDYDKLEQRDTLSEVGANEKFDLIIIDGLENTLKDISENCKLRSIIFIEGDRRPQRELIMSIFPKAKHVNVISLRKNKRESHGNPNFFTGGGQLIFINPDMSMRAYWFKEKLLTYVKRIIRKFL
jgi:hypothetical protein